MERISEITKPSVLLNKVHARTSNLCEKDAQPNSAFVARGSRLVQRRDNGSATAAGSAQTQKCFYGWNIGLSVPRSVSGGVYLYLSTLQRLLSTGCSTRSSLSSQHQLFPHFYRSRIVLYCVTLRKHRVPVAPAGNFYSTTPETGDSRVKTGEWRGEKLACNQSDIHRKVVYSEKVTPLLDKIRESDFDTGYESFTSESGDLIGNLEMQIEQVIDRFAEAAAETQNTSLQEKDSVIEVPKTSIQENHVVDAPKIRRGRPRRHRVKFKERRLSPHEVTPLLDPDTNSEPDSAVGEDTSSESVDSINDLLQHKDNTIQFPKDNTVQVLNSNRQPDDEGLRIPKLSDTRLNSRFTDTRQVYWTQKTNTNNFDLEIHEWEARSKLKKPTVKLKGLFKRVLAPTAMAA
ncbi:hypothetical protein KQX54_006632 [Cotesia glomerata]|uniref:Uncharacterized protein n=1 Tax=Cotesia glomerata TaxID=32391 RepID=A0AAV7I5P0_COTGL|nr:hypothetical protein KQX54_006632 [Cotesia glomerata]